MIYILAKDYRRAQLIARHYGISWSDWRYIVRAYDLRGTNKPSVIMGHDCYVNLKAKDVVEIDQILRVVQADVRHVSQDGLEY